MQSIFDKTVEVLGGREEISATDTLSRKDIHIAVKDRKGEMVSFCCKSKVERHWVKNDNGDGGRHPEDICLGCWKPCELISDLALDDGGNLCTS